MSYVMAFKVFKKVSPNGKIIVYLGNRDFGQHNDYCDPINGVVIADQQYLKDRQLFGQIVTKFRYGREEDEIMGLSFSRNLYLSIEKLYPKDLNSNPTLSQLQERLIRKLGPNAIPFTFALPLNAPSSVTIQPGPEDRGPPLGVEYELMLFVKEKEDEQSEPSDSVSMAIRKLQFVEPQVIVKQPYISINKSFMFSPGKLNLEVSLDRELYFHGNTINVNVIINNYSNRSIRAIKVTAIQRTEVTLINGHYSKNVASLESRDGYPINAGASLSKVYQLIPSAQQNKDKRGIALNGWLKEPDTNLASTTFSTSDDNGIGILISYVIRVRLYIGTISGDVMVEVPFKLANQEVVADNNLIKTMPPNPLINDLKQKNTKSELPFEMSSNFIIEDFARRRQESFDFD